MFYIECVDAMQCTINFATKYCYVMNGNKVIEKIDEARPGLYMMRNKLDTFSDKSEFYCSNFRLPDCSLQRENNK